jgi:Xaa-Pro aminopeptidase
MNVSSDFPTVLPVREQARVVNDLLAKRFETVLPAVMRETGFDMWIIICNEDNHDPVFTTIIPWECWAPILQMVVFYDRGDRVERINISLTWMQGLMDDVWTLESPEDQWTMLRRVVAERNPKRIGINVSDTIWAADGLTASLRDKLVSTLGAELSARLESSEALAIRWLEAKTADEMAPYHHACKIGHAIIAKVFSSSTITPGVTQIEDLRWAYYQITNDLGLPVSFPPFYRIVRSNAAKAIWGENDRTIRPGDMLHCDVGVKYLRQITDHQELAYVLKPGETDAPQGLRDGMAVANRLQDVFTEAWGEGLSGNEILKRALTRAKEVGIAKPKIYSHSLSFFLHEPGPLMGLPWEQENTAARGEVRMSYDTTYTVELGATCPVPEWGGQEVNFALEQDAAFLRGGIEYLDGRQTAFHLI